MKTEGLEEEKDWKRRENEEERISRNKIEWGEITKIKGLEEKRLNMGKEWR